MESLGNLWFCDGKLFEEMLFEEWTWGKFSRQCIQSNDGVDRISTLPDEILTHILSFLTTKEAVHTCILSKRWKNVRAFVPVLEFGIQEFGKGYVDIYDVYEHPCSSFQRFLRGVLQNREPVQLDSLRYWCTASGGSHKISMGWLRHVALLMPRVISIFIEDHPCFDFPDSVFSCASLVNLDLNLYNFPSPIISPKWISLPSLKVLQLGGFVLTDYFTKLLLSGCPVLEEPVLHKSELQVSEISSNVLKKLVIDFSCCYNSKPMGISGPRLISLVIHSLRMNRVILKNIASTVNMHIYCGHMDDFKFLGSLFNVKNLHLAVPWFEDQLKIDLPKCQLYNNLKNLDLKWGWMCHFGLIAYFLEHSPNLQKLSLHLNAVYSKDEKCKELIGEEYSKPSFQREFLERIVILKPHFFESVDDQLAILVSKFHTHVNTIGKLSILTA